MPTSRHDTTPVGTSLARSRSEMCSRLATVGATASSDNATGATASDVMMLAIAKPVIARASSMANNITWPSPKAPDVTTA